MNEQQATADEMLSALDGVLASSVWNDLSKITIIDALVWPVCLGKLIAVVLNEIERRCFIAYLRQKIIEGTCEDISPRTLEAQNV